MEPQDQVSASDKSVSKNEGIEPQMGISSETSPSERNDSGSITENLQKIDSPSDEIVCNPKDDEDKDILPTESSNVIAESKLVATQNESKIVSVEKEESSCVISESMNMSEIKKIKDTILVEVSDTSQEKDPSQNISIEALTGKEKLETTSNESSLSTSSLEDKALSHTNRLASPDKLSQQSNDGENASKYTEKGSQTFSSGTADRVSRVESLRSLCTRQKHTGCGNLQIDADPVNEKLETRGNGKSISPNKLKTSTKASATAGKESVTFKNSADDVETSAFKNTKNIGTVDACEITNKENVMNDQLRIPTETTCEENTTCKNSAAITKNAADENLAGEHSTETPETVKENVTKEHSNVAANIEALHLKQDENVTKERLTTAKTVVGETASNKTDDVAASETKPQPRETEDDSERGAFYYMSSCSVPGMGKEWEWPSVSTEYHYQRPPRRMERRRNTSESRNCLGTQRCHYIILVIGVLGAILGCLTYHLQDYGIGPKVLRPIGASAAFLSFVVCAISSVYLTYLSYYTQGRSSPSYQPVGASDPAASMLIDTMPQGYNSDPRFYFTSSAAATFQQVFRETQSADALDRRGYSNWQQTDIIKRPFDRPGPSGYDPDSKRFKLDPTTSKGEYYEMKSVSRIGEKDRCKERNLSQTSDSSHYTLADQVYRSNSSGESENDEKKPLLTKK